MSSRILTYRGKDRVTEFDKTLNPTFRDLDLRLDDLELRNAIRFYIPGALSVGDLMRFIWPYPAKDISIGLSVNTAPTGAAILCQLNAGGVDVFAAGERPTIADGDKFGVFSVKGTDLAAFAKNDEMILQVDQVGGGVVGSDLTAIIRSEKT